MSRIATLSRPTRSLSRRRSNVRQVALGLYVNDPGIAGISTPGGNRGLTAAHIAAADALTGHHTAMFMISYPWGQGGFDYVSAAAAKAAGRGYCELWRCNSYQTSSESKYYNCLNLVNNGQAGSGAHDIGIPTELINLFPIPIGDGTSYPLQHGSGVGSTVFQDYVTAWALGAKAYKNTVYCRLFHEYNLNTAPFNPCAGNAESNTAAQFIAAWQQIVKWVRAAGATNVKFLWNPSANGSIAANGAQGSSLPFLIATYPGDDYVDICALDIYNQCSQQTTAATPTIAPVGGYNMNAFTGTGAYGGMQFLDAQATAANTCTIATGSVPTFATNTYTTAIIVATSSDPTATVTSVADTHHGGGAPWAGAKMKRRQTTTGGGVMEVWVYDRYDDQVSGTLHPGVTVTWSTTANVGFSYLLVSGMAVTTFDTVGSAQGNSTFATTGTDAAPTGPQDLVVSIVAAYTNQGAVPAAPVSNVAQSIGVTQFSTGWNSSLASAPDRFIAFVPNAGLPVPLSCGANPTYGPLQMRGLRFQGYFTTGTWVTASFQPGDIVVYNGVAYVFQKPAGSTTANPGADQGNAGSGATWNNADGMNWNGGAYLSGLTYNRLDCVYYSSQYWVCTSTNVLGVTPGTDSTKWTAYTPVGPIVAWQLGTSSPWGAITLCLTPLPHSLQTEQGNTTATTGNSSLPSGLWTGQFKWNGFKTQFDSTYVAMQAVTTAAGAVANSNANSKPWMIAEIGASGIGGNKGQWISDTLLTQIKSNYPQIRCVLWWHDTTQLYVAKGLAYSASVSAFKTAAADPLFATGSL